MTTPSDSAQNENNLNSKKISKKANENMQQEGWKFVLNYMKSYDVPEWFRGTSKFQVEAANSLLESLLFDSEQRTCHRVRSCLQALGVSPMIQNRHIKILIHLSRGSDLAFLWFLWELHYKTSGNNYSINEQLILSCIAHLDMITTLRELNSILPPPNPKKKKAAPKKAKECITVKPRKTNPICNFEKLPYFQPLTIPKPAAMNLTMKIPDINLSMGTYQIWEDPNYIVPNEANRWFANYDLSNSKRVVHNIMKDVVGNLFVNYEVGSQKANDPNILCEYHKHVKELKEKSKQELNNIALERCLKSLDIDGQKKEKLLAKIKAQIDNDVEMFMHELNDYSKKFLICGKENQCCYACLSSSNIKQTPVYKNQYTMKRRNEYNVFDEENCSVDSQHSNGSASIEKSSTYSPILSHINFHQETDRRKKGKPKVFKVSSSKCIDMSDTESTKSSHVFFVSNKKHEPWRFNFHKIFNIKHPLVEEAMNVKEEFVKAVDSRLSFKSRLEAKTNPSFEKTINKYTKYYWKDSVMQYNIDHAQPLVNEINNADDNKSGRLKFDRDTFDPNDEPYMKYMLQKAFERMQNNRKLVLAALPDAYKLPIFFYFIQQRYGKRYSAEERKNLYNQSMKVLRLLEKHQARVPLPKLSKICKRQFVSYNCHDYLIEKAYKIRQDFYGALNSALMKQVRIFWFALRPYLIPTDSTRNTFFAYMPARVQDITRFRPWKPSEFMNAKGEWDRRQRQKM